ncbi:MAG: oxygen-independent coproporphyrinogen III oxidase [Acetobacteraceae bacterium]|nr:oxygen-independent coproporphyrinogen III oxidase [Acetobacteraceae bacterium]
MSEALAAYARRAVPRYTSYPTAPHFQPDFAPATYADWLRRTDPSRPVSLYLHVPFCREVCFYCGCNMKLAASYAPIAAYVEALHAEIELAAALLPPGLPVAHLAWGGGTPTALSPDDLAAVMDRLRRHFTILADAELAIESDPRTLTPEMARRIGALGFTRASFGVQEFDPRVQQAINRIQPPDMVARAVDNLRGAGVSRINFDLIYGLPHQTEATLLATIATAAAMRPDRIALFGYAHVPWMAKKQRLIDEAALPDGAARACQAESAAEALGEAGYQAIGLDHFALPDDPMAIAARAGTLRRNFQGYTTDPAETLIGLGATAIGRSPFGHVQNIAETGAWSRAIAAGSLPVAKGVAISAEDRLRGDIIERLMCAGQADIAALGPCADEGAILDTMAADGLLIRDGTSIILTPAGRKLARVVASVFDTYLATGRARHSVAV